MEILIFLVALFTPALTQCVNSTNSTMGNLKRSEVMQELMRCYDSKMAPEMSDGGPVVNTIHLFVTSIDSIVEKSMDYHMNLFIRQSWVDERLNFKNLSSISIVTVDPRNQDNIWTPDLFITNEKKALFHDVTVPNKLMRFTNEGRVLYSLRVSVTASCHMELVTFPLDRQVCSLEFESYGYTMEDLVFKWKEETPIDNIDNVALPHFDLTGYDVLDCSKSYKTGNFTCIRVEFYLYRQIGFYMIQIYVPSLLVVGLSWVNFWIDIEAVPARVSVGLLTVLTITTQSSSSRQSMPKVSYVKAIDVWMSTCLAFVFAALLEFAVVNVYARKYNKKNGDKDSTEKNGNDSPSRPSKTGRQMAREVDKKSRKLFPLMFLVFNIIYWPLYIIWGLLT